MVYSLGTNGSPSATRLVMKYGVFEGKYRRDLGIRFYSTKFYSTLVARLLGQIKLQGDQSLEKGGVFQESGIVVGLLGVSWEGGTICGAIR